MTQNLAPGTHWPYHGLAGSSRVVSPHSFEASHDSFCRLSLQVSVLASQTLYDPGPTCAQPPSLPAALLPLTPTESL